MFLEKLEIQGFKSFASKNLLVFPGMVTEEKRGITAIVGPNGSGKSNTADAVRWVLGEQSMKTLRGKKSEDVIFSGSDKKSKLSMAEVSLFLNNEDRKAPIDYSQVVLTRRLYRDGNSEYLINNSRVRLVDIQLLLAKSSFGQKTYSVIGQGMVEGFLNTSLSERKEFFDEATGVKQYQIKRDEALNKLLASYENSGQAEMILAEIEPRLRSLTKQVSKLQRRGELELELKGLELIYYRKLWHEINDNFLRYNQEYLKLEKEKMEKDKKLESLRQRLSQIQQKSLVNQDLVGWRAEVSRLETERESIHRQLARIDAQLEVKLESSGQFDLSWLKNKQGEMIVEKSKLDEEIASLSDSIASFERAEKSLLQQKDALTSKIRELNANLVKTSSSLNEDEIKKINQELKNLFTKLEQAEQAQDIDQARLIFSEIKADVEEILKLSNKVGGGETLEQIHIELIRLTEEREELTQRLGEQSSKSWPQIERAKMLKQHRLQLEQELRQLEQKLKQHQNQLDFGELSKEQELLKARAGAIEELLAGLREKIGEAGKSEAAERSMLFEMQNSLQALQNEINHLSRQLNDLQIGSTRYGTKLEDLEGEIRQALGGLKEVKAERIEGVVEVEPISEKINSLKRQLEHIGGIDPEVEKEYLQTKERFEFLSHQIKDLADAIGSLEKIIKELDVVIKDKFDKKFKVIALKFEEYFKILFNGGVAKVIKVMESSEDADNDETSPSSQEEQRKEQIKKIKYLQKYNATGLAGIEIQATPPGKKIKSVAMLSGGERALTAIALICAIINVNPSPFVVLDEVDAALDEANSERLAKILDDLSYKTQFIVITHNRASMRRANVLYGVTMGDDGVSKLLSIKLEEARAIDK
ncbi:AAA family ATPase [Candidatus Falkowbacteria bacterium]|nr:AAA family ATPase [Candidatus Falkowbacteria bacterium]